MNLMEKMKQNFGGTKLNLTTTAVSPPDLSKKRSANASGVSSNQVGQAAPKVGFNTEEPSLGTAERAAVRSKLKKNKDASNNNVNN